MKKSIIPFLPYQLLVRMEQKPPGKTTCYAYVNTSGGGLTSQYNEIHFYQYEFTKRLNYE